MWRTNQIAQCVPDRSTAMFICLIIVDEHDKYTPNYILTHVVQLIYIIIMQYLDFVRTDA